jgi:hypothetical protein
MQVAHPWAGELFFGLSIWFVVALVLAAVLDRDERIVDDA